jgi:hypothetical protein
MARRAHADVAIPRAELRLPGRKAALRLALYDKLAESGRVESIEGYVQDPPDGPFRDGTFGEWDWDEFALIRVIGYVTSKPVLPS